MRDPNRIHVVMLRMEELWKKYPDWRFMQLINNIQRNYGNDLFYVEDHEFERMLQDIEENGFL